MRLGQHFGFGLAKAHRFAIGTLHLARQKKPGGDKQDQRQPIHEQGHKPRHAITERLGREIDAFLAQTRNQHRITGSISLERPPIRKRAMNIGSGNDDIGHTPGIDLAQKLAIAHILRRVTLARILEQRNQRQHQQENNCPKSKIPDIRVHPLDRLSETAGA